jgi:hypothetical protein
MKAELEERVRQLSGEKHDEVALRQAELRSLASDLEAARTQHADEIVKERSRCEWELRRIKQEAEEAEQASARKHREELKRAKEEAEEMLSATRTELRQQMRDVQDDASKARDASEAEWKRRRDEAEAARAKEREEMRVRASEELATAVRHEAEKWSTMVQFKAEETASVRKQLMAELDEARRSMATETAARSLLHEQEKVNLRESYELREKSLLKTSTDKIQNLHMQHKNELKRRLDEQERVTTARIDRLKSEHESLMRQRDELAAEEKAQLRQKHQQELAKQAAKHATSLSKKEADLQRGIIDHKGTVKEQLQSLRAEHDHKIKKMKQQMEETRVEKLLEIEELRQQFEKKNLDTVSRLEREHQEDKARTAVIHSEAQTRLRADLDLRLQAYIDENATREVKGHEAVEDQMRKRFNAQIRQLQSETTDLQDDLSSKETELAEGKRQVDRLKRQLAEAESQSKLRLHGMEEQLKLERERIQKTVQEKTLMEESLTEEMQKEADAYKRKLHDANTTIKQLESRSDEHAELRSLFEKEKSELQATVVSANKRRIAAEKECENLQNLVSGLTLQVEAANGEKTELSILVQRNADENALLNSKCASVMAEVDGLRSQIDALEAENRIVVEDLKAAKMLSAMNEGDVLRTKLKVIFSGAHVYA